MQRLKRTLITTILIMSFTVVAFFVIDKRLDDVAAERCAIWFVEGCEEYIKK